MEKLRDTKYKVYISINYHNPRGGERIESCDEDDQGRIAARRRHPINKFQKPVLHQSTLKHLHGTAES